MGEVKFKEFTIKDIFDISTGSLAPSGTLIPGVIPRVTASSVSNGVIGFYGDVSGLTYVEDVVTISFLGDSFYHKGRVSLEMKVHSLSNNRMTGNSGLYVSGVLSKLKKYYSYGSQLSSSKLKTLKIELPTTSEGAPDWDYMDNYIKEIKIRKMKEIIESYSHLDKQKYELEDVEFGEFVVKDTFDVSTGSLAPSGILSPGTIPRVTASSTNNGVSGFYDCVPGLTYAEGIVTISFLGDSFYHKGKVSLEMKVHSLYNKKITDNSGLYISGVLSKLKKHYSYGNQLSSSKLKELKIDLPTTDENTPNWDYMDKYIHNIKIDKVNMIISELESEIEDLSRL